MKILLSPKKHLFDFAMKFVSVSTGLPLSNDRILASPFILACILFSPYGYNIPLLSFLTYGYNADILTVCFQILVFDVNINFSRCARCGLRCPGYFFSLSVCYCFNLSWCPWDSEFTLHFIPFFPFFIFPREFPLSKSSTSSPVVYTHTGISVPSFILGCVQCGRI